MNDYDLIMTKSSDDGSRELGSSNEYSTCWGHFCRILRKNESYADGPQLGNRAKQMCMVAVQCT